MKAKNILLIAVSFIVSCQNEVVDNRFDWIQEIDKTIIEYEKTAEIELSKSFDDNGVDTTIEFYKKDSNRFQKIRVTYYSEYFVDFTQELYVQNDKIVLDKSNGLFPVLYKSKKGETDPCCQVFNRIIYYKNSLEAKEFVNELRFVNNADKEKYEEDLNMLTLKEEEIVNINDGYESAKRQLERLKKRIK